ncbi:potassium-transporting ATPase subunit KdpC [Pseudomonas sp. TTU2014-080ASC]|uniref:potassium-transporting ATPase subunit KdpC n=1 Tax=Pseudomonas sp. TTU2014-080ASC TaxID=1729724 RepID=UPI00071840E1|nr:potassium-transporting ATPase subunit KdpC [Pseudomonas sp. TTU2014-080ASC]KRW59812.1 ATPase [Pseudomonas sp. TTU2014-080ASC]
MLTYIRPALAVLACMTVLTGVVYPLSVTAVAQLAFPEQANGSLVQDSSGVVRGSQLLAQRFDAPRWFHARPSAGDYATVASSASNLAASNPALVQRIAKEAALLKGDNAAPVPMQLVTTSGSGLDPHISAEAAQFQIQRIAAARDMPIGALEKLITEHVQRPLIGPPVVNVLALNLVLADNPSISRSE